MTGPQAIQSGPGVSGEALVAHFERAGYSRATPSILQPAEPFLDLSGEDIRRRMFLTADASGVELCLRPDLTIPVCRDYLRSDLAGEPAAFCYLGPVFRQRTGAPSEFLQAGVESFGRPDTSAADSETVALALEAASHFSSDPVEIRMGDLGLFTALIDALNLPAVWKRRLLKDFNRKTKMAHDLTAVSGEANGQSEYRGVLAALAGSDPRAAHALVTDLLSIAGINAVGGRSVDEIADRFLEQAALGADQGLPSEVRDLITRFLGFSGDPDQVVAAIRALADEAGLDLAAALDVCEVRTGFLLAQGVEVERIRFATAFGRGLDYYTGLVFELHDAKARIKHQLLAGGRYDLLPSKLGSAEPIPAVGFSAWVERLAQWGAMS